MAKRDLGKEIIQGLEEIKAWKKGKTKLRTFSVELPRAADVPAIRKELGLSQDQFAAFMGVRVHAQELGTGAQRTPRTCACAVACGGKAAAGGKGGFRSMMPTATRAFPKAA